MIEDDEWWRRHPLAASSPDKDEVSGSTRGITRRTALVGAASVPLAMAAEAAPNEPVPPVDVFYETRERRALVIEWTFPVQGLGWTRGPPEGQAEPGRSRLILQASTFADPSGELRLSRFVLARTRPGWRATIADCGFPGGPNFTLAVDVRLTPTKPGPSPGELLTYDASLTVSLSFSDRAIGTIALKAEKLSAFFRGADRELAADLGNRQAKALLGALFGDTAVPTAAAAAAKLSYRGVGEWRIAFGRGSFALLPGGGLTANVAEIDFAVLTVAREPDNAPLRLDPAGQDRADVRSLFEGDEAPPALPAEASRALYGLARLAIQATPAEKPWTGEIAMGRSAARDLATLALDPLGEQGAMERQYLAWRRSSPTDMHVALRAPMRLSVRRAAMGVDATVFRPCLGTVWQSFAGTPRLAAALTPTARDSAVATRFGAFMTAPLPSIAPRPGARPRVPPIRLGASGAATNRRLDYFAAPLALDRAPDWLGSQAAGPEAPFSLPICDLAFDEAEALFRIAGVALRGAWTEAGRDALPPPAGLPQAEALINIGGADDDDRCPVRIALSRASLRIRTPRDLASLGFRFRDMILERGPKGWRVTPDRRLAAAVPFARPLPLPGDPPLCGDVPPTGNAPQRYGAGHDPRPLLIVEFPPQHVAERAFLRRFAADPMLPSPPSALKIKDEQASLLRTGTPTQRKKMREAISKAQTDANPGPSPEFKKFRDDFAADTETKKLPADQQIYIGPDWLDIEAIRIARKVARTTASAEFSDTDKRAQALRGLPEVELPVALLDELQRKLPEAKRLTADWPTASGPYFDPPSDQEQLDFLVAREAARDRRDPDYAAFSRFYKLPTRDRGGVAGLPLYIKQAIDAWPDLLPGVVDPNLPLSRYIGRAGTLARLERASDPAKAAAAILATWQAFTFAREQAEEAFTRPVEARLSGPSRLVFRVPLDDYEGGRPDPAASGEPAGSLPFTFEALTNWGAFDLAVVRRAERVFEPLAAWAPEKEEAGPNGRLPPAWARIETRDEAAKLLHQGITRGDAWSIRQDEGRGLGDEANCRPSLRRSGNITGRHRMAEIAGLAKAPLPDETAIEMPFRLLLSPAQDARFRTRLPVTGAGEDFPLGSRGPVPLWFTWLEEAPGAASVRAVWSPDFRPEALVDPTVGPPPHGPWAPWAMPRSVTTREPYNALEPVFGTTVAACSAPSPECVAPERFRTGLDAGDRHEIVALSSLHGLPVQGGRDKDGKLVAEGQILIPPGFHLRDAVRELLDDGESESATNARNDWSAVYRAKPLGVTELSLTALGGTFVADTDFGPPASARVGTGVALFDAFALERWSQTTVLGRDIRVEAVYKGFLFPLGHRASLVKLTERRMMPLRPHGPPVAFLVQRFFLRIGKPDKKYPAPGQANGGRAWPPERVDILTRVTPDLLDPADSYPTGGGIVEEAPNGRIYLPDPADPTKVLPGTVFWPRVSPGPGGEVPFELQIDRRGTPARMPLIFVDNTAANDANVLDGLTDYYNALADGRSVLPLGGSKRRYAAEQEPDATSFETMQWVVKAEGRRSGAPKIDRLAGFEFYNDTFVPTPLMVGVDQPAFFPWMATGRVRITQIERMTGGGVTWTNIKFDDEYRAFGFATDERLTTKSEADLGEPAAKTDIYLDILEDVSLVMGRAGDRIGGPARPDTTFKGISRSRGPVGGGEPPKRLQAAAVAAVAPAALAVGRRPASTYMDEPDPSSFFKDSSRLLGIFTIGEVISFLTKTLSETPRFKELTHYVSSIAEDLDSASADARVSAAAKVRDLVLLPMREALAALARQFFLATQPPGEVFKAEDEPRMVRRLGYLYPDLAKAWTGLSAALDGAIAVAGTPDGAAALLAAFADIYATGRLFLAAVERVAADPVSPALTALRETATVKFDELAGTAAEIAGERMTAFGGQLSGLKMRVCAEIAGLFDVATTQFRAWRRLVFALPGLQGVTVTLNSATIDDFERTIETALKSASTQLVADLCAGRPPNAAQLGRAFATAMSGAIAASTGDLRTALDQALAEWQRGAATDAERVKGAMFDAGLDMVAKLLKAAADLESAATESAKIIIEKAVDAGAAALEAASGLTGRVLSTIDPYCTHATSTIKALAVELLPPASGIAHAKNEVDTKFEALALALEALVPPQTALAGRTREIRDATVAAMKPAVELETSVIRAGTLIVRLDPAYACGDLAAINSALDALAVLPRQRVQLVTALADICQVVRDQTAGLKTLLEGIRVLPPPLWQAAKAAVGTLDAASLAAAAMAKNATALRTYRPADVASILRQTRVAAANVPPLAEAIDAAVTAILADTMTDLQILLTGQPIPFPPPNPTDINTFVKALDELAERLKKSLDRLVVEVCSDFERVVLQAVAVRLAASRPFVGRILATGAVLLKQALMVLATAQDGVVKARDDLWMVLGGNPNTGGGGGSEAEDPDGILTDIADRTKEKLRRLLEVKDPDTARIGLPPPTDRGPNFPKDYLRAEQVELADLASVTNNVGEWLKGPSPTPLEKAIALFGDWGRGNASAARLIENLHNAADAVVSGDLKRLIDLEGARRVIDEKLRSLVPSRISVEYDLTANLETFSSGGFDIFIPREDSRLVIGASAVYELLTTSRPPQLKAECRIEAFDINLFDIVILIFDGARFTSGSAEGSHFDLAYKDFELGPAAAFLQPLQSLMNPGANGPFVRPLPGRPGIRAGYTLDLGIISIGAMSFSNVAITAACDLPFDDGEAEFTASIGSEDRPVLLSVLPYTGGGFLSLTANAKKITGFAASFEFGGGGAFRFGPLTGQGRISTGIYLRKYERGSDDVVVIDGFFYAGGEAHIACFGVAATLVVRVGQDDLGNLRGSATFTYSFSLGITKLEFKVGVSRNIGKGFGGAGGAGQRFLMVAGSNPLGHAVVECKAVSQVEDWIRYRTYFADDIAGFANG